MHASADSSITWAYKQKAWAHEQRAGVSCLELSSILCGVQLEVWGRAYVGVPLCAKVEVGESLPGLSSAALLAKPSARVVAQRGFSVKQQVKSCTASQALAPSDAM